MVYVRKVVHNNAARLNHVAHSLEQPAHLVYFVMVATHLDYASAAIGCLIIGVMTYLPASQIMEG